MFKNLLWSDDHALSRLQDRKSSPCPTYRKLWQNINVVHEKSEICLEAFRFRLVTELKLDSRLCAFKKLKVKVQATWKEVKVTAKKHLRTQTCAFAQERAHTHTHTRARTHTLGHAHTHTYTYTYIETTSPQQLKQFKQNNTDWWRPNRVHPGPQGVRSSVAMGTISGDGPHLPAPRAESVALVPGRHHGDGAAASGLPCPSAAAVRPSGSPGHSAGK